MRPDQRLAHFRTTVDKGLELIAQLRGHTTGYAVPTFVVDAPGGGGKIALLPDTIIGRDGDDLLLRNFAGEQCRYPDPNGYARQAVALRRSLAPEGYATCGSGSPTICRTTTWRSGSPSTRSPSSIP